MPIPISDSVDAFVNRIESVLQAQLPTYIGARSTATYPLPVPESHAYLVAKDRNLEQISEHLGNPDVFVLMMYGTSELEDASANDSDYNQVTVVHVMIILKRSVGVDLPTNSTGRTMLMTEWMEKRSEKYRGVLQDVLTKHTVDGTNINQIRLSRSGVSDPIQTDTGIYREAGVRIEITQQVSVNVPDFNP